MPVLLLTLLLLTALAALRADAATSAVWKCAADGGDVVYQDAPCPAGKELRDFSIDPPTLSVVPGTAVPSAKPAPAPTAKASGHVCRKTSLPSCATAYWLWYSMPSFRCTSKN